MLKSIPVIIAALLLLGLVSWLIGERGKLLMPSTRKFIQMAGLRRFLNLNALHGYIYLRLQRQYLNLLIKGNPKTPPFIRKWVVDRYHSKVLTTEQASKIITLNRDIPLQNLEQVIPHHIARSIVLNASPKIVAFECGCRHARPNPCLPTQVCLFIGEPYADFMLEHHPAESRELTQAAALELLDQEHARGHLHSAWFKDALMERFYAICNCCKCCCGGIENMVRFGAPIMASSGYVVESRPDLCEACGACVDVCPFNANALSPENELAVDWERCMGCGVCVDKCPKELRTLLRDEKKGVPLEVERLAN
ncbi:MAG: 4Fe-4S binding protein [Chloroflexi bacterium]|nr:4Fe-4S binding protein [Chloroflexota bacterium]